MEWVNSGNRVRVSDLLLSDYSPKVCDHSNEADQGDGSEATRQVGQRILDLGATFGSVAAGVTSTAASICCIGPSAIAVLGVNGAILAAGIKPYRLLLLGGSLLMLAYAFWRLYRPSARAEAEACSVKTGRWSRVILWSAAVLWVFAVVIQVAADRYWLSGIG